MFFKKKPPSPPEPAAATSGTADLQTTTPPPTEAAPVEPNGEKPALSAEERTKRVATAKKLAAAFGEMVTLLMRSSTDRQRPLQDLEWMVIPALKAGQFAIAEAHSKETGAVTPIGAVVWAFVSKDVDERLAASPDRLVPLRPEDWRSGDIPWIIVAIGEPKIVGGLLQPLAKTVFKGRPPKMRVRGADGKTVIAQPELAAAPAPSHAGQ
jgi:cytolysin-activating lysine-acyltransferase